jgi:transcriptional/translational regulatory protein YebC/TACO1
VCDPSDLVAVRQALTDAGIEVDSAELSMLPKNLVEVEVEQARSLLKLVDALEENDDVQDVFFNFDIPEAVLEEA